LALVLPSEFLLWTAVVLSTGSQAILFYAAFKERKVH